MTALLDGNALVALVVDDHVHHRPVRRWFGRGVPFATTPITQGTLLRVLIRGGMTGPDAAEVMRDLARHRHHEFWPDSFGYDEVDLRRVIGHRQVTDAYLVQLARTGSGRLVTLDQGLAELHPEIATLLSTG